MLITRPNSRPARIFLQGVLLLLSMLLPSAARAASFTVSKTADTASSVNDPTTLRGAIAASQASPDASDTITIAIGGTITLTQGELLISNPKKITDKIVTIIGQGATTLSISGNNATRIFQVTGGTVNLSGVTLTQGKVSTGSIGGAGILLQNASLILNKCTVSNCLAPLANALGAGIANDGGDLTVLNSVILSNSVTALHEHGAGGIGSEDGSLSVENCIVDDNFGYGQGGGIYTADESAVITGTTISGNIVRFTDDSAATEGEGGGLYSVDDDLTMKDCTIADNSSDDAGGGLFLVGGSGSTATLRDCTVNGNSPGTNFITTPTEGYGGGIFNASATLTLADCTVVGNTGLVGAGIYNLGKLTLASSTLVGNRPLALDNASGGTATVTACILAGNSNAAGTGEADVTTAKAGAITSGGSNLIGDPNGNSFVNDPNHADPNSTGNHDQTGVTKPGLIGLAANGGLTETVALAADSPAIDGDFADAGTTDQRGGARPFGVRNDIGSFEYGVTIPAKPVNTYLVTNTNDSGAGSLRAAITSANADTNAIVAFDPAVFGPGKPQTIMLTSGALSVTTGMMITGPGASLLSISGGNVSRVFTILPINPGTTINTVILTGLTIRDGNAGTQTVTENGFTYTNSYGGGIYAAEVDVTITDCVITRCTAPGAPVAGTGGYIGGGGIFMDEVPAAHLTRCVIMGCTAPSGSGGGILTTGVELFLTDCTISGNTAQMGGGFAPEIGPIRTLAFVSSSTISGNSATTGGGIYVLNAPLVVLSSTIADNTATTGGGIYSPDGLILANSTVAENTAKTCGGLDATGGLTGATIVGNIIAGNMGGNFVGTPGTGLYENDNNLIGDPTSTVFVNGTNHNQTGVTNPKLGPLQDNGGPTQTIALLPGSPAIDANYEPADEAYYTNIDQRGATRPEGVRADIGAFEVGSPVASDDAYTVKENTALTIQAPGVLTNDTGDGSSSNLTATLEDKPLHGSLTLNHDGSFSYTPNTSFLGIDTFTYQVAEGSIAGTTATVTMTVTNTVVTKTPPTTTATLNPAAPNGLNGYYTVPVTITLKATLAAGDPGPATTFYSLDGAAQKTYTAPIKVSTDGAHTLSYFSSTSQGGAETAKKITFAVDATAPMTTASMKAVTSGTQVTLSAKDSMSGVASTVYALDGGSTQTYTVPFTVSSTTSHTVVYHSTDKAGNVEKSQTLTVASGTLHTFATGLQMFSVPADYSSLTLGESLIQSGTTSAPTLAVWLPSLVNYVLSPTSPADHLRPGQGYWVRLNGTGSLSRMGTPTPTSAPFTVTLDEGWNMIGDPFASTISLANVVVTAESKSYTGISAASSAGVVSYIVYSYPAGSSAYVSENGTGTLTPYLGYWVYAFQPCTLTITAP